MLASERDGESLTVCFLLSFSSTSLTTDSSFDGNRGMLINGWHSDKTAERHWHSAIPLVAAGSMFAPLTVFRHEVPLAIARLLLGSGFFYAYYPVFWAIPDDDAQPGNGRRFIRTNQFNHSIGQLGGFVGNCAIGFLNDRTHSLAASFAFIALVYVVAGGLVLSLRVRDPIGVPQRPN